MRLNNRAKISQAGSALNLFNIFEVMIILFIYAVSN